MKKLLTVCLSVLGWTLALQAQVAITQDGSQPDNSAMLDIKSTAKGLLVPRMSSPQRLAIASPATGLIVFDNDQKAFVYYNGTGWLPVGSGADTLWKPSPAGVNFFTTGPTIYTDSAWVGIGTRLPQSPLQITTPDFSFGLLHSNGSVRVGTFIGEGGGWIATNTNHPLYFGTAELLTNLDPQMMLGTNGTVGINTKTPSSSYKLDVNGGINSSANMDAFVVNAKDSVKAVIFHGDILNLKGSDNAINFQPPAPTGSWTIREISDGSLRFIFNDKTGSNVVFVFTPDGAIKSSKIQTATIQPVEPALGKVAQWRPGEEGNTPSDLNYHEFSTLAIKALRMQQSEIKDQQAQIGSLNARLEALEQKIAVLK